MKKIEKVKRKDSLYTLIKRRDKLIKNLNKLQREVMKCGGMYIEPRICHPWTFKHFLKAVRYGG